MLKKALMVLLCTGAVSAAQAQEGMYWGALLSRTTYSEDGLDDANPLAVGLKLGSAINKNFAVEARLGVGLADDSVNVDTIIGPVSVDLKIDNFIGVYGKGILPLSDTASLYGLIGYTRGKVTAEALGESASNSDSDVSYGFGANFAVAPSATLGVEWARLFKGDGYEVDGLTLDVTFKF